VSAQTELPRSGKTVTDPQVQTVLAPPPGQTELDQVSAPSDEADAVFSNAWDKALKSARRDRERRAQSGSRRQAAK
jgi:hypothetical protein